MNEFIVKDIRTILSDETRPEIANKSSVPVDTAELGYML